MPRPIEVLDPSFSEKVRQGICTTCLEPVGAHRDELSRKEYHISGMCQACQDSVFTDQPPSKLYKPVHGGYPGTVPTLEDDEDEDDDYWPTFPY